MSEGWAIMCVVLLVAAFFAGAAFGGDVFALWLKQRHELKMREFEERKRWFEVEAARPRPGEYRVETRGER